MIFYRILFPKCLFLILLGVALAACSAPVEPVATARPARATEAPLAGSPTAIPSPTVPPTDAPTVGPVATAFEATPTPVPTPTPAGPLLPFVDEIGFTVTGHFGGVPQGLDVEGGLAYAGFGPRLLVIDVSDPANPRLLGQSEPLPDLIRDVDVAGGIAYVAAGKGGLDALDVQDPAAIRLLNPDQYYPSTPPPGADEVTVVGNTAYVVNLNHLDGVEHLLRFDVTDPAQMVFLDPQELQLNDSVAIGDNLIVVVGNSRMQLCAAANPAAILSETPLASGSYASRAAIQDNVVSVALAGGPNGVQQFDVSDPAQPVALGEPVAGDFMFINGVVTNGEALFVSSLFGEFGHCSSQITPFDLGGAPQAAASFDPQNCITELAVQDNILYVAGRSGLQLYDASDPANLTLLGHFTHPDGFHDAQGVAASEGLTYVLTAEGYSFDVVTVDLSRPAADRLANRLVVSERTLIDLLVSGDTLIAAAWMGGLNTLDISDPAAPQLIHETGDELATG
ncbi:MAG: hypothetical protein L0332_34365, partial [Chloroflexi bacterium]|nr:hypothetical protein [Chloroflexota bacterium]